MPSSSHRPVAVLVFAILHFVVAGLGLILMMCAGASMAMQYAGGKTADAQGRMQAEMEKVIERKLPLHKALTVTANVVWVVFDIMLIAAGFGLLKMAAWSRYLSISYATLSLAFKLFQLGYAVYALPVMDEAFNTMKNDPQVASMPQVVNMATTLGKFFMVAGPCIMMIYPIAVLIAMNLASVRAAFRGEPPAGEFDDYQQRW